MILIQRPSKLGFNWDFVT